MARPLLSIVTPCLDRAPLIAQAVESVLHQDYASVEHVVVDGGSTDGTLAVLRRYGQLNVTSEKDRGLYDALNKGIRRARGEIIGQLNSDDLYEPQSFNAVMQAFAEHPEADAVAGGALIFEDTPSGAAVQRAIAAPTAQSFLRCATQGVCSINAWFFRRRVYDRIGYFSLDYAIAADRDFLLRFWQAGCVFVPLERPVYRYRYHGGSLTINDSRSLGMLKMLDENLRLAQSLHRSAAGEPLRSSARSWLRAAVLEKAILLARNGRIAAAAGTAIRHVSGDPAWALYVAGALPGKMLAAGRRRVRGRRA